MAELNVGIILPMSASIQKWTRTHLEALAIVPRGWLLRRG